MFDVYCWQEMHIMALWWYATGCFIFLAIGYVVTLSVIHIHKNPSILEEFLNNKKEAEKLQKLLEENLKKLKGKNFAIAPDGEIVEGTELSLLEIKDLIEHGGFLCKTP